ncbi:MAG: tRNA (adenosine(37)-N6)-dimethylallyltransferase MiaA [Candidatus Omnitrophica bacterium]|nr:tRNA (adenosine(37)-N6)-dimethylallyltransferase MiaA [Candidatus Omnitrophota bacterium]MDD5352162.1 tRNA (adenosine(37)-N6)-dimethylallyltransferase MiaA [Candidatus Omnitrophota bacterium]MDD5549760.1 tRNA (adenosine(37)-N6)-dimethylallyltransferase MiaA [Candidatus Omnitrophota bacterium]
MKRKIVFIVGPTASGKTKHALKLAKKIGGEIISCDSMQVYRGLNILSCKPSRKERKQVKHHLIDIINPDDDFNVSKFIKLSSQSIEKIHSKGKIPIFAGGTGLYAESLLNGLFQGPAANPKIRTGLYEKAKAYGSSYLYKRLKKIDPQAADKIHPHDLRRIVRALEVYQVTHKPITKLQTHRSGLAQEKRFKNYIFGLIMPREKLYTMIDERVDEMFRQGVVKEVSGLLRKKCSQTFKQALGIREINSYLKGEIDLEEAKRLLKRNTRRYAKRQMTWFKKNRRVRWLDKGISGNLKEMTKAIV